jgi:hypothetical protein
MMVVMMVMVMTHHLIVVLSHLVAAHLLASFFLRKGRDGEAERNDGRQGNSKLIHDLLPVVAVGASIVIGVQVNLR